MNKNLLIPTFLMSVAIGAAHADGSETDLANKYFNKRNPTLSAQDKAALDIAKRWEAGSALGIKPVPGANGAIRFVFGAQQAAVVCAVLQVCDIALQPGEVVNSINLGDTARWVVDPAVTGSGRSEVMHLIVKPLDVGLETSLVVTTDRRTYHIRLRSHRTEYMPQVAFAYPDDSAAKWAAIQRREKEETDRREATIPATGEYLPDLAFGYDLSGAAPWKPVRVYNDGKKTIIEMPAAMQQTEAPTLLVVRKEGGVFSDDETVMVNYRIQGNRYIVDTVFDRAILIAGVGSSQDRVTITREAR